MRFTLNIGTNVGTQHGTQHHIPVTMIGQIVETTLEDLCDDTRIKHAIDWKRSEGGDWESELVMVVTIDCPIDDFESLWFTLLELVRTTGQDCIAIDGIKHREGGYLLFHPAYSGERYTFAREFFLS